MAADKIKKKNTKNEQINETVKDVTITQEPVTETKEVVEAVATTNPLAEGVYEPVKEEAKPVVEEVKEEKPVVEAPKAEVKKVIENPKEELKKGFIPKSILKRCFNFTWNGMALD